jgi:hypothetical protein
MISLSQKWHHSSGLERVNTWGRQYGHVVPIRFECFHQAPDVHGLRTAAHGAMVIDKLQVSSPRNVKKSAAMIASGKCKGAGPDLRAVSSALFLMDEERE